MKHINLFMNQIKLVINQLLFLKDLYAMYNFINFRKKKKQHQKDKWLEINFYHKKIKINQFLMIYF